MIGIFNRTVKTFNIKIIIMIWIFNRTVLTEYI
jgi:hypothetical protein